MAAAEFALPVLRRHRRLSSHHKAQGASATSRRTSVPTGRARNHVCVLWSASRSSIKKVTNLTLRFD